MCFRISIYLLYHIILLFICITLYFSSYFVRSFHSKWLFSKSFARKQKWVFFFWTQRISLKISTLFNLLTALIHVTLRHVINGYGCHFMRILLSYVYVMLSQSVCQSVCRLSVTSVHLTQRAELFLAIFFASSSVGLLVADCKRVSIHPEAEICSMYLSLTYYTFIM